MKSKVTYQIDAQLLDAMREAVDNGAARTMSEFVQEALRERLDRLKRDQIRRRIEAAARDPIFVEDVRETTQAYGPTDEEGLR
jgi:Arc/MetJ-type ribon-helix-helix transcriptional regulator